MRYSDLKTFVEAGLTALGYDPTSADFPVVNPGPASLLVLQKLAPGRMVFLTLGGGAGLTTEQLFDRPFIAVRAIGRQDDYADAETLAWQLDTMLLKVNSNAVVGTARVLYINRSGGAPTLLEQDSADRYHFTCTYITETQTGL